MQNPPRKNAPQNAPPLNHHCTIIAPQLHTEKEIKEEKETKEVISEDHKTTFDKIFNDYPSIKYNRV